MKFKYLPMAIDEMGWRFYGSARQYSWRYIQCYLTRFDSYTKVRLTVENSCVDWVEV